MNGAPFAAGDGFLAVDGLSKNVEDPAEGTFPYRDSESSLYIKDRRSAGQPARRRQSHAAYGGCVQMGLDFEDDLALRAGREDVVNGGNTRGEGRVHDTAADSHHGSRVRHRT